MLPDTMLPESPVPDAFRPSDRTRVAPLTLRLRSLQDELAATEAASAPWNHHAAREQLRARLDLLIAERRRAIDEDLERTRAEAAASIAAARIEAQRIIAGQALEQSIAASTVEASAAARRGLEPAAVTPGTIRVNFDTEALAAAIAAVLDSRPNFGAAVPTAPAPPTRPKPARSVLGSLVQPDVVLALIGLLIVVSILFAWAT